jgi:hypothetical protein
MIRRTPQDDFVVVSCFAGFDMLLTVLLWFSLLAWIGVPWWLYFLLGFKIVWQMIRAMVESISQNVGEALYHHGP